MSRVELRMEEQREGKLRRKGTVENNNSISEDAVDWEGKTGQVRRKGEKWRSRVEGQGGGIGGRTKRGNQRKRKKEENGTEKGDMMDEEMMVEGDGGNRKGEKR